MTAPAVAIDGLVKRYGDRVAVDHLDLEIGVGEIFGLLGPNGAGKTSTVEILEGYRHADEGTVRVLGLDPNHDAAALRSRIGVMLQEGGLYPGVKPRELLRLFAAFYADPDDPDRLLDVVGLTDAANTMVRRLSGGQAQRLSLALALVGRPELLFLDEPTAGMDPRARADTWQLVRELRERGATVVLTTHYMDEAERLCDRVAIMDHGKEIALGTPRELIASNCAEHMVEFSAGNASKALDVPALRRIEGVRDVRTENGAVLLQVTELHTSVPALIAELTRQNVPLTELRTHSATLEDVFVTLTGRHLRDE